MAVAGDRRVGCEGCGRTVRLDELTTVQMPNGETVACCTACVSHAKAAAKKSAGRDQRRRSCDGCTGEFLEPELETIRLTDGTRINCCPSCAATAPTQEATEFSDADESAADRAADADTTLCQQCTNWVEEELFSVTTIDGRTERLCSNCKERAEADGVIKNVEMRLSQACEVLGVEAGASEERIHTAYHRQIKRAHPDRPSGSRSAFQLVKEAYDRLRNADH